MAAPSAAEAAEEVAAAEVAAAEAAAEAVAEEEAAAEEAAATAAARHTFLFSFHRGRFISACIAVAALLVV